MTPTELFEKNIPLVEFVYQRAFYSFYSEKEDLLSEGRLGLWKACVRYKEDLGNAFSTFAFPCIYHRMARYIKRVLRHMNTTSLDEPIAEDGEGNTICLYDIVGTEIDHDNRYGLKEAYSKLNEKDKQIIEYLMAGYTQDEIADHMGISQPSVHRCLDRFRKQIEKEINQ